MTRFRQRYFAVDAVEQQCTQFIFQRGNALADGGLGDEQGFRCQRKRAATGDFEESIEVIDVHNFAFYIGMQDMKIMNFIYS